MCVHLSEEEKEEGIKITMWFDEGVALGKNGKHEDAIKCFDKVLELEPNNVDALNGKCVSLLGLDRDEGARICWKKVLEIDPLNELALKIGQGSWM